MVSPKSPKIKHAALASLAASVTLNNLAAGSPILSKPSNVTDPYNTPGWPDIQEPTFDLAKISNGGPTNAILINGTDFQPKPTEWMKMANTTELSLPSSCYNCNPKGCMCSKASIESWNNTDVGQIINVCEVCRDSPSGMVCHCAEAQWNPNHACGEPVDPNSLDHKAGDICRLNKQQGDAQPSTTGATVAEGSSAASSDGKKARAAGLGAVAALRTATVMSL